MSENNTQTLSIDGGTYEIRAFFGHQITLEEILAQRVLKGMSVRLLAGQSTSRCQAHSMEAESSKELAHTACLPAESEL